MAELKLNIDGMTCDSCSSSITKILSKKDYIKNIDVSWEEGIGKMDVDDLNKRDEIVSTIERLGYKVVN